VGQKGPFQKVFTRVYMMTEKGDPKAYFIWNKNSALNFVTVKCFCTMVVQQKNATLKKRPGD